MILSINQPAYLPWPGYFDRIARSDLHIVLDHVQFEKNSVVNRNRIRTPQGWSWMTIPVLTKGKFGQLPIHQVEINSSAPWARKHWHSLTTHYSRAEFFSEYSDFFEDIYKRKWHRILPLIEAINSFLIRITGIQTPMLSSSEFDPVEKKSDLVLELCKKTGATSYLSGPFGRSYLDTEKFSDAGIELHYHDYTPPRYRQLHGGFEPNMSIVDLLFNHGPKTFEILTNRNHLEPGNNE